MKIEEIIDKYNSSGIRQVVDYEKFNHISLIHHSTAIEGATLTEVETVVLLNDGLTPRGKPLTHSLMVKDHFEALRFVLAEAQKQTPLTTALLQRIASLVLKSTGAVYRTILGEVDAAKGEFRKGNVYVGTSHFPNHEKVPALVNDLMQTIQKKMTGKPTVSEQLNLSFDAHFHLVSIHPFYDGNGRTSRLVMNYIQQYYALPLAIVPVESRADYFQALVDAREKNDVMVFRRFMEGEYVKQLARELAKFDKSA